VLVCSDDLLFILGLFTVLLIAEIGIMLKQLRKALNLKINLTKNETNHGYYIYFVTTLLWVRYFFTGRIARLSAFCTRRAIVAVFFWKI
jgi:hypothetical protein